MYGMMELIFIYERFIEIPSFMHVVHVEQECSGDDRSALQTVLQARAGLGFCTHIAASLTAMWNAAGRWRAGVAFINGEIAG